MERELHYIFYSLVYEPWWCKNLPYPTTNEWDMAKMVKNIVDRVVRSEKLEF